MAPIPLTRQVYLMGTVCTLTTFTEEREAGIDRVEGYVRILERADQELSTWLRKVEDFIRSHPGAMPLKIERQIVD